MTHQLLSDVWRAFDHLLLFERERRAVVELLGRFRWGV
jgi:hypothetical protein